jgi:hypothetical protein
MAMDVQSGLLALSVAAAVFGVQRGAGLGWHGPRVVLPTRRDLGGPGHGAVAQAFARA